MAIKIIVLRYLHFSQQPVNDDEDDDHSETATAKLFGTIAGNQGFKETVHIYIDWLVKCFASLKIPVRVLYRFFVFVIDPGLAFAFPHQAVEMTHDQHIVSGL
jgi:hypothetical protein